MAQSGTKNQNTSADTGHLFVEQARGFLSGDFLPKIETCLKRLEEEQLWWRANEESNSIGNLLLHLSGNVRQWIVCGLGGAADQRQRQTEFDQREPLSKTDLLETIRTAMQDADAVLGRFEPARLTEPYLIQGFEVTALEAIFHVVEHFSMHTGQIILITKMLASGDLEFYDFSAGAPVKRWHESSTSVEKG